MGNRKFKIYRGDNTKGELVDYNCDITEGMVVLDAMHRIQADDANDMACRWKSFAYRVMCSWSICNDLERKYKTSRT